jgi:hypothetical protein
LERTFSQKGIPHRHGLDDIPADISRRELLAHFSFDGATRELIERNCRLYPSRIALGIQIGSCRMIGRFQERPESAPAMVVRQVARALRLTGEFVPLAYAERAKTRSGHIRLARRHLGLSNFYPARHPDFIARLSGGSVREGGKNGEIFKYVDLPPP